MSESAFSHDLKTSSTPNPFVNPSPLNGLPGRTSVAIVGFEEQNGRTAPYDNQEWEIWGFNMANRLGFMRDDEGLFRADRWFDLHEVHAQSEKDLAWIHTCPVPIVLTHQIGLNPRQRILDLEAIEHGILSRYGRIIRCNYFASSFAYALALAISEGFTTIGLFGVSLNWGRERVVERGNLEYWIGIAEGLGIEIVIGERSSLLTHPGLYGIEYDRERDGVINLCAELVRQLLQSPSIAPRLDDVLLARTQAMEQLAKECWYLTQQIIYGSPCDVSREQDS